MIRKESKDKRRQRVHRRIRRRIEGTPERPRLSIFRSVKHIYAQVIDDRAGHTLVAASTRESRPDAGYGGNIQAAARVGKLIGERAKENGVTKIVFDRGGYRYHGRVKALADAARKAGLEF